MINDGDLKILGKDGSTTITAVTFDMSDAGRATFNSGINLPDNGKLQLGASQDLQIYHDGSNSIIADEGTGGLFLRGTNTVDIQSALGHNYLKSTINEGTKIYYNNSERFETTDSGVNVTGQLLADSATFTNVTGTLQTAAQPNVTSLGTLTTLTVDDITINGSEIQDAGDFTLNVEGDITLDANGADVKLSDDGLHFGTLSRSVNDLVITSPVQDGDIVFKGDDGGSTITAMTIDMSEGGRVGVGTTTPAQLLEVQGNGAKSRFTRTGSNGVVMEFVSGSTASGLVNVASTGTLGFGGGSRENDLTIDASGNVVTSSLRVGNFNVDSADVITITKNALSTGSTDALTYDSAAGQFALNANHVMALIQTVDSNTSGLNADKLDGQHGAYYRINVYDSDGTLLN